MKKKRENLLRKEMESERIKEKYKLNLRNGQEPSCPPSGAVVLHTNLTNYPLQNGKKLALLLYNLNNICLGSASTNDGGVMVVVVVVMVLVHLIPYKTYSRFGNG